MERLLDRFTWMPAHHNLYDVRCLWKSSGAAVFPIDWHSNRPVDAGAKLGTQARRLSSYLRECLTGAQLA